MKLAFPLGSEVMYMPVGKPCWLGGLAFSAGTHCIPPRDSAKDSAKDSARAGPHNPLPTNVPISRRRMLMRDQCMLDFGGPDI